MSITRSPGLRRRTYRSRPFLALVAAVLILGGLAFFFSERGTFELRPASGTAAAMSQATTPPETGQPPAR